MSRVTFTTEAGHEAELWGAERAWAAMICQDLTIGLLGGLIEGYKGPLLPFFPPDHYLRGRYDAVWKRSASLRTWFHVGREALTLPDGRSFDPFDLALNTALAVGNDQTRFLARLHGQCEVHGWVNGPNRAWLADIIDKGVASGMYREESGWDAVTSLLRQSGTGEVVTYYSVTDTFPNPSLAGFDLNEDETNDPWEELSELGPAERWSRCMKAIRARGLEWRPDDWAAVRFGDEVTAFDLIAAVAEIERAKSAAQQKTAD